MTNEAIMRLLSHSLENCYFLWDKELYQQVSGLPMGSRISPILANIFMEELEFKVLTTSLILPKIYFRYVDDVFVVWDEGKGESEDFLQELNQQDPNINLTQEKETLRIKILVLKRKSKISDPDHR